MRQLTDGPHPDRMTGAGRRDAVRRMATVAAVLVLLASGCSSGGGEGAGPSAGDDADASDAAAAEPVACEQEPTLDPVVAEPVDGVAGDLTLTSFDDTQIRIHWFPATSGGNAADPVPTVLIGPGWGQPGAVETGADPLGLSRAPITPLNDAGYNVLTWDPRGFGESGGEASVNDPEREGRDMQAILDWVATQPEALLDRDGDPRVGMTGASYGGGIQLVLASIDCRVDALVPTIAWSSLVTSLYPQETMKAGWADLLADAADAFDGNLDPHVTEASEQGLSTGVLDDDLVDWFAARGPDEQVADITVPTLLIHGTADNLFTPGEAVTNYLALRESGTTVSMVWVCRGHGICLTAPDAPDIVDERTMAWLDRHLKGDDGVDTGPVIDILDQRGDRWVGDDYPAEPERVLEVRGGGDALALTADSVAGPVPPQEGGPLFDNVVVGITPARAEQAIEATLTAEDEALVVGAPRLTFTYSGLAPEGDEPTRVFAQLVDDETGHVLGNQISPVPVMLDGDEHEVDIDLEVVVHHLEVGDSVTLQIVATTPAFATPRLGGEIEVTALDLALPVTGALARAGD
jgi:ABC-2 type transport system ATP-binding protein